MPEEVYIVRHACPGKPDPDTFAQIVWQGYPIPGWFRCSGCGGLVLGTLEHDEVMVFGFSRRGAGASADEEAQA